VLTEASSREFNRNPSSVKKSADKGPVLITERGEAAYVILSYSAYTSLTNEQENVLERLAMPEGENIDFNLERDTSAPRDLDF
tara:strand:- start:319 stop:567 length:249 start_codon:yes stop_codon:yes gene_type:complete